jgi:putative zincin peptidase
MSIFPKGDAVDATPTSGQLRLVSRFLRGARRTRAVAALRAGNLQTVAHSDLLSPARLPGLARDSLSLLVAGGAFFAIVNILAWDKHGIVALPGPDSTFVRLFLLVVANIIAYSVMLPLHEAVHAATILALGGRPTFGLRLPFAAYCTAPGQVFTRQGYMAVALAPLVVLTVVGVVITILWPQWATWLWFGFAGNISGAVGDLVTASEVRQLPPNALIADNEAGYTAYTIGGDEGVVE